MVSVDGEEKLSSWWVRLAKSEVERAERVF